MSLAKIIKIGLGKKLNERQRFFAQRKKLDALQTKSEVAKLSRQTRREERKLARQDRREERKLRKMQIEQAQYYAKLIPNALATQKRASVAKQQQKNGVVKKHIKKVQLIPPVLIHRDYYMFQINTVNLPTGVSIDKLRDPEMMESLRFALSTDVQVEDGSYGGFWYLVARVGGLGIIPKKCSYEDVYQLMPKRAGSWAVAVGLGNNKKLTWLSIAKRPHMLIAGSTGAGKSVYLKQMLLTLALNNSPTRFRFIIADFKGGADFVKFNRLPHIGTPSRVQLKRVEYIIENGELEEDEVEDFADYLITEPDDLLPILKWADRETNRRNKRFADLADYDITNINEYNAKFRRKPMPRIMLVLDEYPVAVLEYNKKTADKIKKLTGSIARKGRSAGVHVVLGSQMGASSIMDGAISQNIQTRIVGKSTGPQSQVLLGNWFAYRISANPGRMAFKSNNDELELQTPWISQKSASKMIEEVAQKWGGGQDEDSAAVMIFKFALERGEGYYDANAIHKHFDESISRSVCLDIAKEYQLRQLDDGGMGPEIPIDGVPYYLLPGIPGKRTRKLVTVAEYEAKNDTENDTIAQFTIQDIFEWVLDCNDGKFVNKDVYEAFRDKGAKWREIVELGKDYIEKTIIIKGEAYILAPHKRTKKLIHDTEYNHQTPNGGNQADPPHPEIKIDQIEENITIEPVEVIVNEDDDIPDWLQGAVFNQADAETRPVTVIESSASYTTELDQLMSEIEEVDDGTV